VTKGSSGLRGKLFNVGNVFVVRLMKLRTIRCVRTIGHIGKIINACTIYSKKFKVKVHSRDFDVGYMLILIDI
jgi:hypothetical protein